MWRHCRRSLALCSACNQFRHVSQRTFLSRDYALQDVWENRWPSLLEPVSFGRLSIKMIENFEKFGKSSVIDMEMLTKSLQNASKENVELVENIVHRFRHSDDGYPVPDTIVNAIVRSYMDLNYAERLIPLIKDKLNYGLILDHYTANLLMGHFIGKNMIKEAADVAYEMMLQEDTSSTFTNYLCLYSCIKRFQQIGDIQPAEDEPFVHDEEEQWTRVNIIHRPVYDDHFDITKEHFKLGKSLYYFGKAIVLPDVDASRQDLISHSLQFLGLGLYNKFNRALDLLENWIAATKPNKTPVLSEMQINTFRNHLEWSPTRDPNEEELELGLQTVEYMSRKLYMTEEEKTACTERFENLVEELKSFNGVAEEDLYSYLLNSLQEQIKNLEKRETSSQAQRYEEWKTQMVELYNRELSEGRRLRKQEEIETKMTDMAEREELILSHEKKREILMARVLLPKEKKRRQKEELDEDELEDKMKNKKSLIKKKKK